MRHRRAATTTRSSLWSFRSSLRMACSSMGLLLLLQLFVLVVECDGASGAAAAGHEFLRHHQQHSITLEASAAAQEDDSNNKNDLKQQRRSLKENKLNIQQYELIPAAEIREMLYKWADHYSDFVQLTNAQDAYGLKAAGGDDPKEPDCPFDTEVAGCRNYILKLQDYQTYPADSDASKRLPEVLWSGEVHGNEQVGPTAVLEATNLLLQAAACEQHPRLSLVPPWYPFKNATPHSDAADLQKRRVWLQELARAKACRQELRDFGISDQQRKWLARLLATRRIVVVPTANALGYFRKRREEGYIDPNRDFPYDLTDPRLCMQTIAARTLNEVFRQHMFQLSLTFHGGMEVVGYEWGAPTWQGHLSPDDAAQQGIAAAYSHYGGHWKTSKSYQFGTMNQLVYPVNGGMEDWAYAASWDPDRVVQCRPKTWGGYPKQKTVYDNSTLRVFNMLIETSNNKIPHKSNLGTSENLLTGADSKHNGHVARNIRLALLAAELVQPYVVLAAVNDYVLRDDVIPTLHHDQPLSCQTTHALSIANDVDDGTKTLLVEWNVGGALTVDNTQVWYGLWKDVANIDDDNTNLLDCWTQPNAAALEAVVKKATPVSATSGLGTFSAQNGKGIFNDENSQPQFSASIDISEYTDQQEDLLFVIAVATVDSDWKNQPNNIAPHLPPQSHIVNARTNDDWYHVKTDGEGSIIQGRTRWFSQPLTIRLGHLNNKDGDTVGVAVKELLNRFPPEAEKLEFGNPASNYMNENANAAGTALGSKTDNGDGGAGGTGTTVHQSHGLLDMVALVVVLSVAVLVARHVVQQRSFRTAHRNRVREFIEDETLDSPGLRGGKHNESSNGNHDVGGGGGYEDHPDDEDTTEGEVEMGRYTD